MTCACFGQIDRARSRPSTGLVSGKRASPGEILRDVLIPAHLSEVTNLSADLWVLEHNYMPALLVPAAWRKPCGLQNSGEGGVIDGLVSVRTNRTAGSKRVSKIIGCFRRHRNRRLRNRRHRNRRHVNLAHKIVTVPFVPSTSIIAPFGIRFVASFTETTQGSPSSRLTMTACET